ncbi:AI-2E family transporter [Candidatus Saccharibacteria bacterium]|nr:AI-2E family transporter [Candidatus Saccharibacteria bacterium]
MAQLNLNRTQQNVLVVATVLSLFVAAWFLQNFITLILFSGVVVVLFNPVYQWLLRHGLKSGTASMLTLLVAVLAVIIPVLFVSAITIVQIERLISIVTTENYTQNISQFANHLIDIFNKTAADLGLSYRLTVDAMSQWLVSGLQNLGTVLVNGIFSSLGSIFGFITTAIIFLYVFLAMLVHQNVIIKTVKQLNPLGDEIGNLYLARIHAMTKATVRGQFIIAACQGLASAAVLSFAGLHGLFFFFLLALTVLSIVPLGAGIVTIPIGAIMILTGNVLGGIAVIANHLVVVTNIDNILRPILVPREAKLNSALMILAVFAGLGLFGFFGIVLGPVLMIILMTTLQVYLEVFKGDKEIVLVSPKERTNIATRLRKAFSKS